jgi:hypothetical protein
LMHCTLTFPVLRFVIECSMSASFCLAFDLPPLPIVIYSPDVSVWLP